VKIPLVAIPRLSQYARVLLESRHSDYISSDEISEIAGCTAAQVRKDLAYFGQFGTPSRGYKVEELKRSLSKILGTDREWNVALVGVGNLGSALLSYKGFAPNGFKIKCAFDNDLRKIGKNLEGVIVRDTSEMKRTLKAEGIRMAIVTVGAGSAQSVVNMLIKSGVTAILNFAPVKLNVARAITVLNIDLSIELERLAYFLSRTKKSKKS